MSESANQGYALGEAYAARFEALAASGADVHGEATFCTRLLPPSARILDAGCGTGRVAARLVELGYRCVGTDVDSTMLEVARKIPGVHWIQADLTVLDLNEQFDLVVCAGNVVPLVPDPPAALARIAAHLRPGGYAVFGFGLARTHLPAGAVPFALADFDAWCAKVGLALHERFAGWDGAEYSGGPYAVSVAIRA